MMPIKALLTFSVALTLSCVMADQVGIFERMNTFNRCDCLHVAFIS